jgi:hypothetical protein
MTAIPSQYEYTLKVQHANSVTRLLEARTSVRILWHRKWLWSISTHKHYILLWFVPVLVTALNVLNLGLGVDIFALFLGCVFALLEFSCLDVTMLRLVLRTFDSLFLVANAVLASVCGAWFDPHLDMCPLLLEFESEWLVAHLGRCQIWTGTTI